MFYRYRKHLKKQIIALHALYSVPVLSAAVEDPGFVGDNFSNNLLSDLAPLISLFGEQVTKQYLSQSMHWLEHIIFACAPLGMITAITCAIRVAGSKTLTAIIGRAREPGAQAEIEVMSSTSPDVCELWNGIGIVRVAGSPDIIELLYDREHVGEAGDDHHHGVYERNDVMSPSGDEHSTHPRRTSNERPASMILNMLSTNGRSVGSESYPLVAGTASEAEAAAGTEAIGAPNISLNTTNPSVEKWELQLIAAAGVVLQIGVLAFDWTAVYYSGWQWKKDGFKVQNHAFPLTLVGTLAVSAGMFLCAYVIEVSTIENEWVMREDDKRPLQILWLQRGQTVNDQKFKSYAIYAAQGRRTITTSRPLETRGKNYHLLTTLSTITSVCGFILQFVGLRAMHYSATLAQLVAMVIMTALRVVLRRNLTAKLKTFKAGPGPDWNNHYVKELPKDHELDLTAKQMVGCSVWKVVTRDFPEPQRPESEPEASISRVLKTRVRLNLIADFTWKAKLNDTVVSLIETIETLMNHLWSPSGEGILPIEMKLLEFYWTLPVTTTSGPDVETGFVNLRMDRRQVGEQELGPWRVNRADIEAVFSLWMSHLSKIGITGEGENLWVIGATGEGGDDVGRVLCDWWISREIDSIDMQSIDETCSSRNIHDSRVLYCTGSPSTMGAAQGIITTTSPRRMCAQFILSKFMAAAAKQIKRVESKTSFKPITGKRLLHIVNKDVDDLAEIFRQSGLATVDDAYRILVPALFEADTLPNILDRVPEILDCMKEFESVTSDEADKMHMEKVCTRIRSLCIYKAGAFITRDNCDQGRKECMRLVKSFVEGLDQGHSETKKMRLCLREFGERLTQDLIKQPSSNDATSGDIIDIQADGHLSPFPLHHAIQTGRVEKLYNALLRNESHDIDILSNGKTPLSEAVQCGDETLAKILLSFGADPASYDDDRQTALHHAASAVARHNMIELLLDNGANINDQQNPEKQTPLHLSATIEKYGVVGEDIAGGEDRLGAVKLLAKRGANLDLKDRLGRTAMHKAAGSGSKTTVGLLVKEGADPDVKDNDGRTAMHKAAEEGHSEIVQFLIGKGSDPFIKDNYGETAIHAAARNGHESTVKALIKGGVNPDSKDKLGETAMYKAAQMGKQKIVRLLLDTGSDPDVKNHQGQAVVHAAAKNGDEAILELLLEGGGDLNAKDKLGRTTLHMAAENGHQAILQLLMDTGCDLDLGDIIGETAMQRAARYGNKAAVEFLIQNGADPDVKDQTGRTAIHHAAEKGKQEVLELFLDKGSGLGVKDHGGKTAMHIAAGNGHESTIELLIRRGGSLKVKDKLGKTALHWAAEAGQFAIIKLFLGNKFEPNVKDNEGKTALHTAAGNGHEAIVNLLLQQGANQNAKDKFGRTAVHRGAEMGQQECVRLLLEEGTDVGTRDINGETAIHTAASNGHEAMVQLLLNSGANPNFRDIVGRTPLHKAAEGGYGGVVKILLGSGADLGARDNSGKTAADIAQANGKGTVQKLLAGTRRD